MGKKRNSGGRISTVSNSAYKKSQAVIHNQHYSYVKATETMAELQKKMRFVNGEAPHPQRDVPRVDVDAEPIPIAEVVSE